MAFKAIVLCASVLLVQGIFGRCIRPPPSCGCGSNTISIENADFSTGISEIESISVSAPSIRLGNGFSENQRFVNSPARVSGPVLANSGGSFIATSVGPVTPRGIRVDNNNELYGELLLSGALPYLTAVAFEGSFPTDGAASVAYGCGDGEIAITEVIGGNAAQSASYRSASYGTNVLSSNNCGCNRSY